MSYFQPGQRVEHQHHSSTMIFRETLVKFLCADKFYCVVEDNGKEYLVRTDRLRKIGSTKRATGVAA